MSTLTRRYATIGGVKVRLAAWLPSADRYQDRLVPVDPNLQFLPNDRTSLVAQQASTFWQMNEWRAGEGFDRWAPDREGGGYFESLRVRPKNVGNGLVLGALAETTKDSGAVNDFADGRVLGLAQGTVWTLEHANAYAWNTSGGRWGTAVATGATTELATSLADPGDTWVYAGFDNKTIRRFKTGSNQLHFGATFTYDPVVVAFGGRLFGLDGDDLYEIDLTTANTRTLVVDVTGSSADYLSIFAVPYRRLATSDKGPIWLQRLDNGQTLIWEYNVSQDVGYIIGELPAGFAIPTSIYFARGFVFVAYKTTNLSSLDGDAYIYFQRGAQRGALGPVRRIDSDDGEVVIAGVIGDDLMFYFNKAIWAYNFSAGGISHVSTIIGTPLFDITHWAVVVGADVFLGQMTGDKIERYQTARYTASGFIDSGLYDMGYLDIPKKLVEVTILTEPLPANTSVSVAYTTDGTTYTALTGAHDVDGASEKTWIVSSSAGTTVRGRRFGIRLTLATTDATVTPTVRGVLVRARSAAHERQIIMRVDCSTDDASIQETASLIASLRALVDAQNVVSFSSPFLGDPEDADQTVDVEVRNLVVPDAENPGERLTAIVELAAVELVVA